MVVIQHQQQGRTRRQVHGQLVQQTVQPFFESERLMALTHFQQPERLAAQLRKIVLKAFEQTLEETPRIVVPRAQTQPKTLPMSRQALTELHGQRTLAES